MEEVAPVTHSEASLRAPEEIQVFLCIVKLAFSNLALNEIFFNSQTPSQGVLVGDTERSATDKKRQRRYKKKRQHAIALSKGKRKALKDLSVKLKKTSATKSSSRFFASLENEAKVMLKNEKSKASKLTNNAALAKSSLKL